MGWIIKPPEKKEFIPPCQHYSRPAIHEFRGDAVWECPDCKNWFRVISTVSKGSRRYHRQSFEVLRTREIQKIEKELK